MLQLPKLPLGLLTAHGTRAALSSSLIRARQTAADRRYEYFMPAHVIGITEQGVAAAPGCGFRV